MSPLVCKRSAVVTAAFCFAASAFADDSAFSAEGCSHGFWKQPHHFDRWIGYSPSDLFVDVFWLGGLTVNCCENQCVPSCQAAGNPTGCSDPGCESLICGIDPFCCSIGWDAFCASVATAMCACVFADALQTDAFSGKTLLEVLTQPSGPPTPNEPPQLKNLGRQAVAALLNASSDMAFPLTEDRVKSMFIDAHFEWLAGSPHSVLTALKDVFELHNDADCAVLPSADLNGDGFVNVFDMIILLQNWSTTGPGDLNLDGRVNIFDLLELLAQWSS